MTRFIMSHKIKSLMKFWKRTGNTDVSRLDELRTLWRTMGRRRDHPALPREMVSPTKRRAPMSTGTKVIGAAGMGAVAVAGIGGDGVLVSNSGRGAFVSNSGRSAIFDSATTSFRALELPRLEIPRLPEIPLSSYEAITQPLSSYEAVTSSEFTSSNIVVNRANKLTGKAISAVIKDGRLHNDMVIYRRVSKFYKHAEQIILNDLVRNTGHLTKPEIEKIINDEVTKTILKTASQPKSGISFEVLTGKLTIDSSRTVVGIKLAWGEVNIYKVSAALAASVVACEALAAPDLKACVKAVLAKAGSAVDQELKLEQTNDSKESVRPIPNAERD
jgi:hypothetical protein